MWYTSDIFLIPTPILYSIISYGDFFLFPVFLLGKNWTPTARGYKQDSSSAVITNNNLSTKLYLSSTPH